MPSLKMWPTSSAVWKREPPAAVRARVALPRLADVGEAGLEVAPVLDARAGASPSGWRPRRTGPRAAPRRRGSRRRTRPGRSSRDRRRTPGGSPPRWPGGSRRPARPRSSPPRDGRRRERARARPCRPPSRPASPSTSPPSSMPRNSASASMVVAPGVSTSSGASRRSGNSGARGMPRATSRSAA